MDLADIRKKARQQTSAGETCLPDRENSAEHCEHPPSAVAEELVPVNRLTSEALDGALEEFFPGLEFATEEEYIQGLSGRKKTTEQSIARWLSFMLGDEEYALPLEAVLELIKPRELTELPQVPDYVRGLLSLRGAIVPIIDLCHRLGLVSNKAAGLQRIIVCAGKDQPIGLLVDKIVQVVRIPVASIEDPPLVLNALDKDYVSAVGRYQERLLILLDPEQVLQI